MPASSLVKEQFAVQLVLGGAFQTCWLETLGLWALWFRV